MTQYFGSPIPPTGQMQLTPEMQADFQQQLAARAYGRAAYPMVTGAPIDPRQMVPAIQANPGQMPGYRAPAFSPAEAMGMQGYQQAIMDPQNQWAAQQQMAPQPAPPVFPPTYQAPVVDFDADTQPGMMYADAIQANPGQMPGYRAPAFSPSEAQGMGGYQSAIMDPQNQWAARQQMAPAVDFDADEVMAQQGGFNEAVRANPGQMPGYRAPAFSDEEMKGMQGYEQMIAANPGEAKYAASQDPKSLQMGYATAMLANPNERPAQDWNQMSPEAQAQAYKMLQWQQQVDKDEIDQALAATGAGTGPDPRAAQTYGQWSGSNVYEPRIPGQSGAAPDPYMQQGKKKLQEGLSKEKKTKLAGKLMEDNAYDSSFMGGTWGY